MFFIDLLWQIFMETVEGVLRIFPQQDPEEANHFVPFEDAA